MDGYTLNAARTIREYESSIQRPKAERTINDSILSALLRGDELPEMDVKAMSSCPVIQTYRLASLHEAAIARLKNPKNDTSRYSTSHLSRASRRFPFPTSRRMTISKSDSLPTT